MLLFKFVSVVSAVALTSAAFLPVRRATVCNGRAELCERKYSNVTFLGAHDSFGFDDQEANLARNQQIDIPAQLQLGVRLLQAQAHKHPITGRLHFCHTSCFLFDGGRVEDFLRTVKTFLDENRNEVVTFIFTNPDDQSVKDVWKPAFDAAEITKFAFVPPSLPVKEADWPTLGELIDSDRRLIVFLDKGANTAEVDFILPQFDMIWETPFSVTDPAFPCKVDRITGQLSVEEHTYMINHSLNKNILPIGDGIIIPDFKEAETTNSVASIIANAEGCRSFGGGRNPQFVLLDFVDVGEGMKAVDQLNGF